MDSKVSEKTNNKISKKQAAAKRPPKRMSRKRARKIKTIKRIIASMVTILLLSVCIFISFKVLFIVREVKVEGTSIYSQQDITAFCKIPEKYNIFKVKPKEIKQNLTNEFIYAETITVKRNFPDKIIISMTDSQESYYMQDADRYKIYSQNFRFLRYADLPPPGCVHLNLDIQNDEIIEVAKQVIKALEDNEFTGIDSIIIPNTNDIQLEYSDRFEIKLGTMLDMDYKLKMCKKTVETKIGNDESGILDATKAGTIIYKRK